MPEIRPDYATRRTTRNWDAMPRYAKRNLLAAALAVLAAAPSLSHADRHPLDRIEHFVVIYQENHSFDNLYGGWEGVDGIANARAVQVDQNGKPFRCLAQNDVNLTSPPLAALCNDAATGIASAFGNAPFALDDFIATAAACPPRAARAANGAGRPGGCTRDLGHRFYQEQYQLHDGRMDRYVAGSDALGLAMGYYDTKRLPIYRYLHRPGHPRYVVADRFFQAAFGGSFLNHQWLIAARTPEWKGAVNDGSAADLHSVVDANGMPANSPLYASPSGNAVKDQPLTASCNAAPNRSPTPPGVACGDFAVNTAQPWAWPYAPGTPDARRLPPLTAPTIGDALSSAGVDWAWYSGGWANAEGDTTQPGFTNGSGPACSDDNAMPGSTWPRCPDRLFQFHHQPFNYYASFAPGSQARARHLRDEAEFLRLARSSRRGACKLKAVSFVKPLGTENEHPGYASEHAGSGHLVDLIEAIAGSTCARDTLIIVTYDEFGGQADHVPPPGQGNDAGSHDRWGPGTRIPALVISPRLNNEFAVDHTLYDTTSILATLERRFKLAPLASRDAASSDLAAVFGARPARAAGTGRKAPGAAP
jgi:phospholipase C